MLKLEKLGSLKKHSSSQKTDEVTISAEAKKRQINDLVAQEMIEKLTTKDPNDE